jgi:outer membrane receptor protein involved in Fe transport
MPRSFFAFAFASTSLVSLASAATAQTANAAPQAQTDADKSLEKVETGNAGPPVVKVTQAQEDSIVVTGSRIRRPNVDSAVPLTSISGDQFFETGSVSIGDTLNQLPALRSTFSQSNSTRFLGTSGLNLLDLRGLGTQRTLVLVNGRRHVAGDILNTAASVDTNTIPTDLIERTDIVTGGDSAVYGSDALAGVVNFVLKDHFDGFQVRGQAGISQFGDAGSDFVSVLAGRNFADGRGNVAINLEYARQDAFYASDRNSYRTSNGFVQVADAGSATQPQSAFYKDIRNGFYSNNGTYLAAGTSATGGSYAPLIFQPDGTLVPQTGMPVGLAPFPNYLGGNGDNFRDGTQLAFQPNLDRYSVNIIGHFEISKTFVPFFEVSFSRTNTFGSASGPFFTGTAGETFSTDNPYLNPQARAIILADNALAPTGSTNFSIYKNAVDLTNRAESAQRDTFRVVGGVRGDLGTRFHYEVSANYGQLVENTHILGNVNYQRYLLAIDAVDQGLASGGTANGNIVCRSKVNSSGLTPFNNSSYATSTFASDIANCVPVNLFGASTVTQAARNYLLQDSFARGKLTQLVLSGNISGDTGAFFNLPGGPVGFDVGAEYRRETAFYQQDAATSAAVTFYNAIPLFSPTSFEVKEAFGELRLPILKDLRFAQDLTISAAGRVANYKGSTGTVFAYNVGGEYSPLRGLRFRTNYSQAVRAPNLSDLYLQPGQNYFQFNDPCAARNITLGSNFRQANCQAAGVPANYDAIATSTPGYFSAGQPNLRAETSKSLTFGAVLTPAFLRGFSFSADYYHIVVNNVINTPGAQSIINACYDLPTLNNQFCSLFKRDVTIPVSATAIEYVNNSLTAQPFNYAKLVNSGIDFEAAYQHQFSGIGEIRSRILYTLSLQQNNYLDIYNPTFYQQIMGTLSNPRNSFIFDLSLKSGNFTIGYKLRYLDKMTNGPYENYNSVQGRAPTNPYAYASNYTSYPVITYHSIRGQIDVNDKFNIYAGVDNLFDQLPPFGLTGTQTDAIYPNVGRFLYVGVSAKL